MSQAEQEENFSDISIPLGQSRHQILAAQFECYLRIIHDPPQTEEGDCNTLVVVVIIITVHLQSTSVTVRTQRRKVTPILCSS